MADREPLSDPRDYVVELSGEVVAGGEPVERGVAEPLDPPAAGTTPPGRPFISIHFKCCSAYNRIYKTADGTAYAGHCPKCAKPVRVKIGPGGSSIRTFIAE